MNDALIESFFNGFCTEEEAVKVLAYLKQHPEHPYLLNEWNTTDAVTPLPAQYTQAMYDVADAHVKKTTGGRILLWRAAAACIIAATIALWIFTADKKNQQLFIASKPVQNNEWIEQKNISDTAIVTILEDGSAVTIFPKTTIRYHSDFAKYARRDIYMRGEAYFEVAKNKEKPFTVYSGYVSTTALGTAFRVMAPADENSIKVRLNEGKVVVAVTDSAFEKRLPDYYLLPGQELVLTSKGKPGLIHTFIKNKPAAKSVAVKFSPQQDNDESYLFNNQTLADVLDQLAVIYNVKINYSEKDIGTIYFIGKIERNEPVEKIISDIALLNKLSIKKQRGGFILTRTNN
ncbi:MAG: FecR family protein [Bacteroidota bacterium]